MAEKRLPRGVYNTPGENRIPATKVLAAALEAREQQQWCDQFWTVLYERFAIVQPPFVKTNASFVMDPADHVQRDAIRYADPHDNPNIAEWTVEHWQRFFFYIQQYVGRDTKFYIQATPAVEGVDPNASVYIDRDYLLRIAKVIQRNYPWDYENFWQTLESLGFERPVMPTYRISFEFTPGKDGVPHDFGPVEPVDRFTVQALTELSRYFPNGAMTLANLNGSIEIVKPGTTPSEEEVPLLLEYMPDAA